MTNQEYLAERIQKLSAEEVYDLLYDIIINQGSRYNSSRAGIAQWLTEESKEHNDRCEYWDSESNFCSLHRPSAERHGRWIKKYRGNYLCSVCGAWYRTTDNYGNIIDGEMRAKYCETCGAKMDLGEENESR